MNLDIFVNHPKNWGTRVSVGNASARMDSVSHMVRGNIGALIIETRGYGEMLVDDVILAFNGHNDIDHLIYSLQALKAEMQKQGEQNESK